MKLILMNTKKFSIIVLILSAIVLSGNCVKLFPRNQNNLAQTGSVFAKAKEDNTTSGGTNGEANLEANAEVAVGVEVRQIHGKTLVDDHQKFRAATLELIKDRYDETQTDSVDLMKKFIDEFIKAVLRDLTPQEEEIILTTKSEAVKKIDALVEVVAEETCQNSEEEAKCQEDKEGELRRDLVNELRNIENDQCPQIIEDIQTEIDKTECTKNHFKTYCLDHYENSAVGTLKFCKYTEFVKMTRECQEGTKKQANLSLCDDVEGILDHHITELKEKKAGEEYIKKETEELEEKEDIRELEDATQKCQLLHPNNETDKEQCIQTHMDQHHDDRDAAKQACEGKEMGPGRDYEFSRCTSDEKHKLCVSRCSEFETNHDAKYYCEEYCELAKEKREDAIEHIKEVHELEKAKAENAELEGQVCSATTEIEGIVHLDSSTTAVNWDFENVVQNSGYLEYFRYWATAADLLTKVENPSDEEKKVIEKAVPLLKKLSENMLHSYNVDAFFRDEHQQKNPSDFVKVFEKHLEVDKAKK